MLLVATDIVDVSPEPGVRMVELDALLAAADIVTIHADARPTAIGTCAWTRPASAR